MKRSLNSIIRQSLVSALFAFPLLSIGQQASSDVGDEEEVVKLSPFVVNEDENLGYLATTTLAGTRLNTQLKDVGAAISVMTKELFDDIGATDAGTLLSYGLNTETSGVQGNFVGGSSVVGSQTADLADTRTNPQRGQRIRGLASADLTRNFFQTDIPFDAYNTERVTISRGPNSLLFGIGSPGGVINNSTMNASSIKDFGEVSIRLGERSSHRETFNYNKVLIQDRLGLRIAGLYDKFNYQQRPTYDEKQRVYLALEGVLFENNRSEVLDRTVIKVNYEKGEENSNPPNIIPPGDGISNWLTGVDPALEAIPGVSFPARLQNFTPKWTVDQRPLAEGGTDNGVLVEGDFPLPVGLPAFIHLTMTYEDPTNMAGSGITGTPYDARSTRTQFNVSGRDPRGWDYYMSDSIYNETYVPNFRIPSLPLSVFDNENMSMAGTTNLVTRDFDSVNVTLEQTFWNGKAGIEVSFDEQNYETTATLPFTTGARQTSASTINVDLQEYLSDGTPNPNVGRAVITAVPGGGHAAGILSSSNQRIEREGARVTAFADLDFTEKDGALRWLGRHVFTGLLSNDTRDTNYIGSYGVWDSHSVSLGGDEFQFSNQNEFRLNMVAQVYLTPPLHNNSSVNTLSDLRIPNYINIALPREGQGFQGQAYDRRGDNFVDVDLEARSVADSFSRDIREIDTQVLSLQSYLLDGHLVGLIGFRNDEQSTLINPSIPRYSNGVVNLEEAYFVEPNRNPITGEFETPTDGDTVTWSLVAHVPDTLMDKLPLSGLSFHYNNSENFNPVGLRTDVAGFAISAPESSTTEYGFTASVLNNKLTARVNWFDMSETGGSTSISPIGSTFNAVNNYLNRWLGATRDQGLSIEESLAISGFPPGFWSSYDEAYNAFIDLIPDNYQNVSNYRLTTNQNGSIFWENDLDLLANPSATRDFSAKGFEIDLVGQITDNWRVMLNVGQQETIETNIAPKVVALAAAINSGITSAAWADYQDDPVRQEITFRGRWNQFFGPLLGAVSREGTVSLEQRKWRWNAVTNYSFSDGMFKGVGVGAAARWQDKVATGYPLLPLNAEGIALPDLENPYWGPTQLNGDLWVSYTRKLFDGKVDWKIQFNFRNAFGDDDIIPVATNPDGQVAIYRNSLPKEMFLTNTFSF